MSNAQNLPRLPPPSGLPLIGTLVAFHAHGCAATHRGLKQVEARQCASQL